ncbi:hypothetical protein NQ315_008968 [Exocentrus adspersus]|uniref:Uncharacterized protein n=1 Tax=Exocentrus adspersus TaxID=1586481 RepID=A0AAV8VJK0_9CUCU|nr:hypothetical protein NQ315_008968 [Exocentrus adspersus]
MFKKREQRCRSTSGINSHYKFFRNDTSITESNKWTTRNKRNISYANKSCKRYFSTSYDDVCTFQQDTNESNNSQCPQVTLSSVFKNDIESSLVLSDPNVNTNFVFHEEICDIFSLPEDYSLAHCVAADMQMSPGIAVQFRNKFRCVEALLEQRQCPGGLAILQFETRFIYYLVTKNKSVDKPTYDSLWCSLIKLRKHIKDKNVKKLAIPILGCVCHLSNETVNSKDKSHSFDK